MEQKNFQNIEGIKCYAPDFAYESDNFNPEDFQKLYKYESNNFWFKARNELIDLLFKRYVKEKNPIKFLEIGCGTGFVINRLSKNENVVCFGAELHLKGLKIAKERLPQCEFVQMNALNIPYENEFHVVGAFDVIEHIEDDVKVIEQVNKALRKDGIFLINVPQHMWLWSSQDDAGFHKRRYSKKEMTGKLIDSGFEILYATSFVFLLLPFMIVSRLRFKKQKSDSKKESNFSEFEIPEFLNRFFEFMLNLERVFHRLKIRLPIGGSLVVVARKKSEILKAK